MTVQSGPSTVGAGKSGADAKERFGPDHIGGWITLAGFLVVVMPTAALTLALTLPAGLLRRVRFTRMLAWTAGAAAVSLVIARLNPVNLVRWHWHGWIGMFNVGGLHDTLQDGLTAVTDVLGLPTLTLPGADLTVGQAVLHQLPLAVPIGILIAALAIGWASYRRSTLAELEDPRFDFTRPFGILDALRRRRSTRRIQTGRAVNRRHDTVAVGTGRFGHTVNVPVRELQRTTFFFGMIRSGKTAAACSLVTQAARGGALVINFKGEGDNVASHYARFARANNRIFKHFALASKSGQPYQPPIDGLPEAAQQPACYDPLRHGNADSKTSMLQNSVDRDGDAAVYLRTAEEFTLIAYRVAHITGYDVDRSGFQVLHDLCDMAALKERLTAKDEHGRPYFNPDDKGHQRIAARVEEMDKQWAKDATLRSAVANTRGLLSSYMNGAAAGSLLRPGPSTHSDIDLVTAVTEGHVVVFSLPVQAYKTLARTLGTLVLLDLQNAIDTLREKVRANNGVVPWRPFFLHIEEFGSAGPEAVLDILNKAGDVNIYPVLSTQAWADLTRMAGGEDMAKSLLEQAGNVFTFAMATADGATVLADMTREENKKYPRAKKEFAGGLFGFGLRAAETGQIEPTIERGRQATPSDIQRLAEQKHHRNNRTTRDRIYECLWIACYDGGRVTHTYDAYANNWVEPIRGVLCDPEATAERFPKQIYSHTPADMPIRVAPDEVRRANRAEPTNPDPTEDLTDAFSGLHSEPPPEDQEPPPPDREPDFEPPVDRVAPTESTKSESIPVRQPAARRRTSGKPDKTTDSSTKEPEDQSDTDIAKLMRHTFPQEMELPVSKPTPNTREEAQPHTTATPRGRARKIDTSPPAQQTDPFEI